jgi:hypothetical protein
MLISRMFPFFAVVALLTGCATTPLPPFPRTHPASPEAPEASAPPARPSLSSDEATRTTNDLLKGTEQPTTPSDSMQNMPGMHH